VSALSRRWATALLGCLGLIGCEQSPKQAVKARRVALPSVSAQTPAAIAAVVVEPLPSPTTTAATLTPPPEVPIVPPEPPSRCNEQTPHPFLIQAHFDSHYGSGGTAREWTRVLERAVRYRTEQYGYVEGFGDSEWNARTPSDQARAVTFFGVPVLIHRRIAPALSCVETAIRARCADQPYQPSVLSGLRKRNTYVNGEISNHVYGIALDVDPVRNPCCGCIGEWRLSERCQNEKSKFERMDMPRCWVTQFERFGFYWLGHAKIEDTMHFEFLADPTRIARKAESAQ